MKLTEIEKNYTWKQWLEVIKIAISNPLRFYAYMQYRKIVQIEQSKSNEQKIAEIKAIRKSLEDGTYKVEKE